ALVPRLRGAQVILNMFELMPEMTQARLRLSEASRLVKGVSWVERMATSWADRVITVSEPCRRILEGRGLPGEKVTVLPNTQPTYLTAPHVTPQKPVLITHTTVIERYGVQVAIQAVHQLARAWPDMTYQVFGDGEYLPVVRELVQELGVADRTVFHGFVPADEL